MYTDKKRSESEQSSKGAPVQPNVPEGRVKDLGNGRYVLLCDESDCPCSSDMNMGREICVFHYSVNGSEREYVTKWLNAHRSMVVLAKLYDRYGVLDDERTEILLAFNRESVSKGWDELPPEGHPYFMRPIVYCLHVCRKWAEEQAKKDRSSSYEPYGGFAPITQKQEPTRQEKMRGMISRLLAKTKDEERRSGEDCPEWF